MVRTKDDTGSGTEIVAGFGNGRCFWDASVCVDSPTHFVTMETHCGADAEMYCVRHYVLTLARLCQVHLPSCEGGFTGHVSDHGNL